MAKKHKGAIAIVLIIVLAVAAAAAAGYGMYSYMLKTDNAEPITKESLLDKENPTSEDEAVTEDETAESEPKKDKVGEMMEDMSLSDMVYQMMFVTPESLTGVETVIQAGDATKSAVEKQPVGGIVYFSKNLKDRAQTTQMIKNTQSYSKIPLFIGVDEEGGRVARLGSNSAMGVTKQPPMREIGKTGDGDKAYEVGKTLANDIKQLGFNVDFAPDSDVLVNENNTEIGDRSFGTDPDVVSLMVKNVVSGLQDNGVSSSIKHFPGHGATHTDSHTGYSEVTRTAEQLRKTEFLPFKAGIDAGVDFVMVSHMTLTNATEEKVPSSISKEVITDMLFDELGFTGIAITDSFSMGAITEEYTVSEAVTKAVKAGADMILMPSDLTATHDAIVSAVKSGDISQERIEKSVRKILSLKVKRGMI